MTTVGKLSLDLNKQAIDNTHCAEEQMREQLTDYDKNLHACIEDGKRIYIADFYVVVLTKKERLMQNVIRSYFLSRYSCPTPEWDQVLYKYTRATDKVDFMWVVPSKDTCKYFIDNALEIHPEEHELRQFVLDFQDGSLLKLSKRLNGEVEDSLLLDK